jgi:hypothetical protein
MYGSLEDGCTHHDPVLLTGVRDLHSSSTSNGWVRHIPIPTCTQHACAVCIFPRHEVVTCLMIASQKRGRRLQVEAITYLIGRVHDDHPLVKIIGQNSRHLPEAKRERLTRNADRFTGGIYAMSARSEGENERKCLT